MGYPGRETLTGYVSCTPRALFRRDGSGVLWGGGTTGSGYGGLVVAASGLIGETARRVEVRGGQTLGRMGT